MNKSGEFLKVFGLYYLPIIIWMVFIWSLSSISGLKSGADSIAIEIVLRKLAHLLEYSILAVLVWRVFHFHRKFSLLKIGLATFMVCLLYAISDEIHQFFIEERAGRVMDVLIDSLGIFLGVWGAEFFLKK